MVKGTIHKRRLLKGVGRWGPPKGDLRRRGVDTLILAKEMSFFNAPKINRIMIVSEEISILALWIKKEVNDCNIKQIKSYWITFWFYVKVVWKFMRLFVKTQIHWNQNALSKIILTHCRIQTFFPTISLGYTHKI